MEGHRARLEGDRRVASAGNAAKPLRLLLSSSAARDLSARVSEALGGASWIPVAPGDTETDFDVAFVSRDVTGLSTKHEVQPATQVFYDALLAAPSLQWVHVHSAGADRPVYVTLRERGVQVTTSSGANAPVVAVSALAGLLALARRLPLLLEAQRERRWAPLFASGVPRDLEGQSAVVVGWGPIGQQIGALLQALGLRVAVARQHHCQRVRTFRQCSTRSFISCCRKRTGWCCAARSARKRAFLLTRRRSRCCRARPMCQRGARRRCRRGRTDCRA